MKKLAWAKFKTPIMLKISVRPLANRNNNIPYRTPLKSEKKKTSKLLPVAQTPGTLKDSGPPPPAGGAEDRLYLD